MHRSRLGRLEVASVYAVGWGKPLLPKAAHPHGRILCVPQRPRPLLPHVNVLFFCAPPLALGSKKPCIASVILLEKRHIHKHVELIGFCKTILAKALACGGHVFLLLPSYDNSPPMHEKWLFTSFYILNSLTNSSNVFCLVIWNLDVKFFFELHNEFYCI